MNIGDIEYTAVPVTEDRRQSKIVISQIVGFEDTEWGIPMPVCETLGEFKDGLVMKTRQARKICREYNAYLLLGEALTCIKAC